MKARDYYYLTNYTEASQEKLTKESLPYIIGSLCFLGRHDEARLLFQRNELQKDQLVITRFHLGLSYTRTSDYNIAKEYFLKNMLYFRRRKLSSEAQFFVFQGLAFFQFFFSKHRSSQYFAYKALQVILRWKKGPPLLSALVKDIIAHNYYQLGHPFKAQKIQAEAIEVTQVSSLTNLHKEFLASSSIYKSEYSDDVDQSIKELKSVLKTTPETNDYTRSELVLQISKLMFLQGSYNEANQFILTHFDLIYKNENKRKVAKLNTLLAQILFQKKQFMEGLSLLRVAKSYLTPEIDTSFFIPILGLEIDALSALKQNHRAEDKKLKELISISQKAIPKHIQARKKNNEFITPPEDLLGTLFDGAQKRSIDVFEKINERRLYHLIKSYTPNRNTHYKKTIFIHPKNQGFYTFSDEAISYSKDKLSTSQINLLKALQSRLISKEQIITTVWGYDYDPLRHDHLVYTAIRRLRKSFKENAHWIQSTEELYGLDPDVEVLSLQSPTMPSQTAKVAEEVPQALTDLNFRQLKVLEGLFDEYFSSTDHSNYFKITRMTAFRDLDELITKGLVSKSGKGRGTKYSLNY